MGTGIVGLKLIMMDHFGLGSGALFDPVNQVIQQAHNEVGALIGRQKLPYLVFNSLCALHQVPDRISNFVLDLTNVFVIVSFSTLDFPSASRAN